MDDNAADSNYERHALKWNGWGREGKNFHFGDREDAFWEWVRSELQMDELDTRAPLGVDDLKIRVSDLPDEVQEGLVSAVGAEHVKTDRYERLFHAVGKSFRDLIRIRSGAIDSVPDAVVYPGSTEEVAAVIAVCNEHNVGVIPYGGGSSVVGGVEALRGEGQRSVVTVDTTRLANVLSIDEISQTAVVQAGIYGPPLEKELQSRGYTLGHYPQSFEFSTVGGWIAARGSGQQSNAYGCAAKWLCAAKVVSPAGVIETHAFPNSAAGPDLNHVIAGSEGTLGIITEATVQLHEQPASKDYRGYFFRDFIAGAAAIRELLQREVSVSMLRLSDADETLFLSQFSSVGKKQNAVRQLLDKALSATGYGDNACMLLVGAEGDRADVTWSVTQTTAICVRHGALPLGNSIGKKWYEGRFEMPYLRDPLLDSGVGVDTLETATTWSNVHHLHQVVGDTIQDAIRETSGAEGIVMCHISHSYRTGASLYFTFVYKMDRDAPLDQWTTIKERASRTLIENGGTISHHHGVGADHLPWMEAEKGEVSMSLLKSMRQDVDPRGIMNPGKTF